MRNTGEFFKVSFEQFKEGVQRFCNCDPLKNYTLMGDEELKTEIYDKIKLPDRSTAGSAGYDFYFPFKDIMLLPGESIVIPTGIRVYVIDEWYLAICPKSGLSFDYKIRLDDTIAIIDGDYFNTYNEGHIYLKISNENNRNRTCVIPHNSKIAQGIFHQYGIAIGDKCTNVRTGGMGHSDPLQKLQHTV